MQRTCSRAVLSWKLSNTMDTRFCLEALDEAVQRAGKVPEIFNTDQGRQFTSRPWRQRFEELGVQISMDGKGRWMDNVFIERLWRSVKYEEVYLREYQDLHELECCLGRWFERYNHWRPHQSLNETRPWEVYRPETERQKQREPRKIFAPSGATRPPGGEKRKEIGAGCLRLLRRKNKQKTPAYGDNLNQKAPGSVHWTSSEATALGVEC